MNRNSIFGSRDYYKPFDYPEFMEGWSKQQSMFWTQYEISMVQDKYEFYNSITEDERKIIINVLRFFTQSDIEVSTGYISFLNKFNLFEIRAMLVAFLNMETIHVGAYSYLVDELQLPSITFKEFMDYEESKAKKAYLNNYDISNTYNLLKSIALFSGFVEGCALFSSFCMLINLSRFGLLNGIAQISTFSMRDETLHTYYMTLLFKTIFEEVKHKIDVQQLEKDIQQICLDIVYLEDNFIDGCMGNLIMRGLNKHNIKSYIRRLSKKRIIDLGFTAPDGLEYENIHYPCWIDKIANLRELVDFFSSRPTEYSKKNDSWDI